MCLAVAAARRFALAAGTVYIMPANSYGKR